MEITQKEEMNRVYTRFSGEYIEEETYPVQIVLHHLLKGLLCTCILSMDGEKVWSCEHTGTISLSSYCQDHELNCKELKWIWCGILETILETEEYLLDAECLYLDETEIYLDITENKVQFCYVPFIRSPVWEKLQELAQYLLGHLNQKDAHAVQMAYGIFHYLAHGGKNVDELWRLIVELDKKQPDPNTDIFVNDVVLVESKPKTKDENIEKEIGVLKEKDAMKKFSMGRWIMASIPLAIAIFLCAYVAFNEWYLSDKRKIVLLIAAAVFGGIGIILWKRWGKSFKKENFFDEEASIDLPKLVRADTKEELCIEQIPSVIGKLPEAAQLLIQAPTVSRIHAKITLIQGIYYIEDLNSKNGTYLNGRRLEPQKPARLEGNDELAFADIYCYFQLSNR